MRDVLTKLFSDYDRGNISRRHLLQVLGAAVAVRPALAFAQGSCGGANASLPRCDKTPGKLPFEPTGWKTVLLDHFSMQVADYQKEAAYFAALMNWKVRSDDGKQAVLDIGDWGGIVIKGGYQPPPPPTPTPEQVAAQQAAAAARAGAAGAGAAAGGAAGAGAAGAGRGGGRGGGGGGRAPRAAIFDGFCWGIEPWDAKKVEAELKKRGLNPVADNDGKDFQSFRIKDASGMDLQVSNGNSKNRRRTPANAKLSVAAPFEATAWKTVWLDHISFNCANYKENVAFYTALLGWKPGDDEGSQNQCQIGDVGDIIIRGGNPAGGPITPRVNNMDHIAFGIAPWDPDAVKAELDKRGLSGSVDTGGNGSTMEALRVAKYQSFHTNTPNGYNLQISKVTKATRGT